MNVLPAIFTSFLVFVLQHHPHAQNPNFTFQKIEGLSQNTVFNIHQDKQGFLWVATGDGLNRYDGKNFRSYKPSPTNEPGYITGRVIRNKIIEGSNHNLWIGTESGLQKLNKRTNTFSYYVPFNDSLNYANGSPYPIIEKDNVIWFGKSNAGILSMDLASKKYTFYPFPRYGKLDDYYAEEQVVYSKGNCWFSRANGLFSFNIISKTWQSFLPKEKLKQVGFINDNLISLSNNGMIVFNTVSHSSFLVKFNSSVKRINAVTQGPRNSIWLGDADGNIFKYLLHTNTLTFIGNINAKSGNVFPVYDLYFDATGILWIGTDGMGLLKANIDPPDFYKFPDNEQSGDVFIKSIYEDPAGLIWLGTFGHGVIQLNRSTRTSYPLQGYPFNESNNQKHIVSFIQEDQRGSLWIGFGNMLYVKKKSANSYALVKLPVEGNVEKLRLTGMSRFKGGVLFTTTMGCFMATEIPGKNTYQVIKVGLIGDFSFIHQIDKSHYILGYLEGGLHLFNLDKHGTWSFLKKLLNNIGVKCIYNDTARNLLWFGTDKGLLVYNLKNETHRIYSEADGLNNSFVYGILESGGELWISTNGGLSNIKIKAQSNDAFPSIICKNYKVRDGLQSDEFNTNAFAKGRDGMLYFGGIKGINWFDPKNVAVKKKIEQTVIVSLMANNQFADTIAPEFIEKVVLPYDQNNLYLQFCGLEFTDPERINYAYILEGWDKSPINSQINEVRYNNLSPGEYLFRVGSSNEKTAGLSAAKSVLITILPPYWRTWWFYSVMALLGFALLISAFRINSNWRVKKEREKLQQQKDMYNERMRIAREMHDDIGAGLTQISLISASAKLHAPPSIKMSHELEAISTTARQLVDNLGEIIWALNPRYNTVDMLLSHIREQVGKLTDYANIKCHILIDENIPNYELSNQQRRNILLVTKEIVHNAIKHCEGKNLFVKIMSENDRLHFDVSDDGKGFQTDVIHKGNGLKNIRHRIEEIGGVLRIESSTGNGCRFVYDFPLS